MHISICPQEPDLYQFQMLQEIDPLNLGFWQDDHIKNVKYVENIWDSNYG